MSPLPAAVAAALEQALDAPRRAARIACVACLDPARSVHTPGFLRAVSLAEEFALEGRAQVLLFDDRANAETARGAAGQILAARPEVVVGHFASSAAGVAAPLYRRAGLPLVLPAATQASLTEGGGVYRLCDTDADLCDWLAQVLDVTVDAIETDGSAHGESLRALFAQTPAFQPRPRAETVLFSGMYRPSVAFVAQTAARCVVLTDDADMPMLAQDLARAGVDLRQRRVLVAALRPQPRGALADTIARACLRRHGLGPGTYFWETVAALQVATEIGQAALTGNGPWLGRVRDTVLGPIRFDAQGEARLRQFHLRDLTREGLSSLKGA